MKTETISVKNLQHGLRPSAKFPRNNGFLVNCEGAVGRDGVLHTLDECDRLDTHSIDASFPYPQIFVFINTIIVCTADTIYELIGGTFVEKLATTVGSTWTAVDFYDYVYLSNNVVAVVRDSSSKAYSIVNTLPVAMSMVNFNGQVIVSQYGGETNVIIEEVLNVYASPIVVTTTMTGDFLKVALSCSVDPLEPDQAIFGDGHSAKDCIQYLYEGGSDSVLTFSHVPAAAVDGITYYDFKHYLIVPSNVTVVIENNVRLRFYQVGAERGGLISGGLFVLPESWVFEDLTTYGFAVWFSQMTISKTKWWGSSGDYSTDNFKAISGASNVFEASGTVQMG